jgi:hypothetical protein
MFPEQVKDPLALSIVHPVFPDPPAISTLPVEELAIWTLALPPAFKVRSAPVPEEMFPAPIKFICVGLNKIVSREETPLSSPEVETLRPVEEIESVPLVFPIPKFPEVLPSKIEEPSALKLPEVWEYPVTEDKDPEFITSPLIVFVLFLAEIVPKESTEKLVPKITLVPG